MKDDNILGNILIQTILDATGHVYKSEYYKKVNEGKAKKITKKEYLSLYEKVEDFNKGNIKMLPPLTRENNERNSGRNGKVY